MTGTIRRARKHQEGTVPLSDEEARLLHQLEQSLAAEDPDFASTLRGSAFAARNRKIAIAGGLGFVLGLLVLLGGAIGQWTWVGLAGFLVMLVSAYAFAMAWKRGIGRDDSDTGPAGPGPQRSGPRSSGSFVDRMEERWQRRQDGDSPF